MRLSNKRVFVGLSGGVDSSVAALLLKTQGYQVVGVYMKNWSKDLPGLPCPWKDDFSDAKRVAVQLGIDFKMYDFEKDYQQKVVDTMIEQYKAGLTPNPDITCNQEVKFKLFLNTALQNGADFVATGHYARIAQAKSQKPKAKSRLLMAKDANKDQTYFLYRVSKEVLQKTLFPLGELTKPEVRALAKKHRLVTAGRKESMGICFVGNIGIKDFLSHFVKTKPGRIIDQKNNVLGEHDGAIFYTIGQRHGLEVGGGLPYYVVGKSMAKNEVYVTTDLQDEKLWSNKVKFTSAHWINELKAKYQKPMANLAVRTRHRAPLIKVKSLKKLNSREWVAQLQDDVRALTPGQSAVFYSGQEVLGGGILV